MKTTSWTAQRLAMGSIAVVLCMAAAATAAYTFSSVEHLASGQQQKTFEVECDFDKFRQIMIRRNATRSIIAHSGMTLVDERIDDIQVDTSQDDRPLLNAILGHSKSDVSANKEITVKLEDPELNANQLVLRQKSEIEPGSMHVITKSKAPAGNLESYETTLQARPNGDKTQVDLTLAMQVRVRVPKLFTSRADSKVQQATDDAIEEQAASINAFIVEHADKRVILPKL